MLVRMEIHTVIKESNADCAFCDLVVLYHVSMDDNSVQDNGLVH